ncbi:MAG: ATP-binding protein [bacterium]|nr:ATP-binding protein [bacterium]
MQLLLCPDANPNILGFFDTTIAPSLLFYAYIPILIISLLFGIFVWKNGKSTLSSKYFVFTTISFATWIILILFQWIAAEVEVVHLAWQLLVLPEILIYIFSLYFCYTFLFRKDLPNIFRYILSLLFVAILALLPTAFNIDSFDLANCEGVVGRLWDIIYVLELVFIIIILIIGIEKFFKSQTNKEKILSILFSFGTFLFLGIFWISNYFGELTKTYEINLWGPIGAAIFLGIMSYLIVKFEAFNIRLLAAQALVFILTALIGSQFFFVTNLTNQILVGVTFLLAIIFGFFLVKSVKREIEAKEKIEKLAGELQTANEGQANLIHIINHQIKGYLAKARNIFSELLSEPEYGPVSESAKPMINEGLKSLTEGVGFVTDFLNASNIEKGTYKYEMQSVDIKALIQNVVEKQRGVAEEKGLSFEVNIAEGDYNMRGDKAQLEQAVRNLIDNSIRYTPKGGIKLQLSKKGDQILFKVSDTGVGISDELKPKLFTKGGRDKDSLKVNVNSTGFGLSFVKDVAEAHRGRVWAESAGPDKGSTFYMELPISSN